MKNIIELTPRGSVFLANGEKASAGEASYVKNLRERDGVLTVVGRCATLGELADGEQVVFADESEWGLRLLSVLDGKLMWYGTIVGDKVEKKGEKLADIPGRVMSVKSCGDYVVVAADGGIVTLRRQRDAYELYDANDVRPLILFSATEAGTLTGNVPAYTFAQAYSSWIALNTEDKDAISKQWLTALRDIRSAARSGGQLCGVVAVRCGVRLFDDSYLWFGAPVLIGGEQVSSVLDWTERAVTADGSGLTGVNAGVVSMPVYRLGITVAGGIPEKWDGVVKAVDVLMSDEIMLADLNAGEVECRCSTTNAGGSRRQSLVISPRAVDNASALSKAVNVDKWHVVSSTTDLNALRKGKWSAVGCVASTRQYLTDCTTVALHSATGGRVVKDAVCADAMRMAGSLVQFGDIAAGCGRLYCGNVRLFHTMPWSIAQYFSGEMKNVACVAAMEVTFHTDDGVKKLSAWENIPFTPSGINALVSFPDVRASHFRLWLQGDADVLVCEGDLYPNADATQAVAVDGAFSSRVLTPNGEKIISLPELTQWEERLSGSVAVSACGNPFSLSLSRCVEGIDIKSLAVSVRPLYGGVFGRYPLFLFCGDGLYAVRQLTDGSLDDARLISNEQLMSGTRPCVADDAIAFLNRNGCLMRLSGAKIVRCLRNTSYQGLVWNGVQQELWLIDKDGVADVMMPSGRCYRREERVEWAYSSPALAMVGSNGVLLDITRECDGEKITVEWLSQPVLLDDAVSALLRRAVWSVFSDCAKLRMCLYGERGLSCHGYPLSALNVNGVLGAPMVHRVVASHLRSVRAELKGTMQTGDVVCGVSLLRR